jgi:L-threonylcarbamoyladenylate synthase
MQRFSLSNNTLSPEALQAAAAALRAGKLVLYPTDTQYALGADARSNEAVGLVYQTKGRAFNKPLHATFADMEMAKQYAVWDDRAEHLAKTFLPGPLTLVLPKQPQWHTGIFSIDTVGIRMPDDSVSCTLAKVCGFPITATSANRSGEEPAQRVDTIIEALGETSIDVVLDVGAIPARPASTIITLTNSGIELLREGPIPFADVLAALV